MATWTIDKAHSEIGFRVKHLVIATVTGHFKDFDATVVAAHDDFSDATITFEANVGSIDTKNEQRDGHLRSADFFDAENFPKMSFISKRIERKADDEFVVTGDMTIRGVTKEVKLSAVYNGTVIGMGGAMVAGFDISGKLNRTEFGLKWNMATEAGGLTVSEEVKLDIAAELIRQDASTNKAEAKEVAEEVAA